MKGCCTTPIACSAFECNRAGSGVTGTVARAAPPVAANGEEELCLTPNCSEAECCEPVLTCVDYACTAGSVPLPTAGALECPESKCADVCCSGDSGGDSGGGTSASPGSGGGGGTSASPGSGGGGASASPAAAFNFDGCVTGCGSSAKCLIGCNNERTLIACVAACADPQCKVDCALASSDDGTGGSARASPVAFAARLLAAVALLV
jgi:hypothetical protein